MLFWLLSENGGKVPDGPQGLWIVQKVNELIGTPVSHLEQQYTLPVWKKILGTDPEKVLGPYTPQTAVPWYTVMFIIACIISIIVIWLLKRKLSEDEPSGGQQTLEVGVLAVRNLIVDVVGPHGVKYFPVVATFGVLILVSNLLGFIPGMAAPTSATSVTFALGISSFVYYNYIGIKENGLFGHLRHFAGPVLAIAPLLFLIELISNLIRPMSLGIRLFGNMFADEKVTENIANLAPPTTYWLVPVLLMPLGLFVAFIQTFIFMFLSMVYISEVSHPPHTEHGEHGHEHVDGDEIVAPVLT
ncbi:MAG: F-type H+-transporting ATPase subunit a [Acidobacteriota bacterium]|jgi:F-type H+-transporting ATPase subunit a|nr:F-type H+-transporting ATPase subunit a [Acidobacteriota bacterium]